MASPHRCKQIVLGLSAAASLAGCATRIEVTRLASSDPAQAFYELRGHRLARLRDHAAQLCPAGLTVLRQAESIHAADPGAGPPAVVTMSIIDLVGPAEQDRAQLMVQCPVASQSL